MKKKFEIGKSYDKVRDAFIPCIYVDDSPFMWGILPESLHRVKAAFEVDPTVKDAVMMDIQTHFLKSLSKFAGKQLTMKEVNDGLDNGYIE